MNTLRENELYISSHIVTLHLSRHRTFNNASKYRSTNTNREPNAAYVHMYIDCRYVGRDCIGICYSVLVFVFLPTSMCTRKYVYAIIRLCAFTSRNNTPEFSSPLSRYPLLPLFLPVNFSFISSIVAASASLTLCLASRCSTVFV